MKILKGVRFTPDSGRSKLRVFDVWPSLSNPSEPFLYLRYWTLDNSSAISSPCGVLFEAIRLS
ncbi:hypothetical protein OYT1_ch2347 [Ferriphaselus amnicola]|uniref:Uncharacterized protein n=1 Tax=Ferriphaselus amnicola TaxID=1188319 RepID=A0A2Z6GER7_9PROT|nr:hypothetical protein OYT1_ch2347 [Ferriphaselus amnicola]